MMVSGSPATRSLVRQDDGSGCDYTLAYARRKSSGMRFSRQLPVAGARTRPRRTEFGIIRNEGRKRICVCSMLLSMRRKMANGGPRCPRFPVAMQWDNQEQRFVPMFAKRFRCILKNCLKRIFPKVRNLRGSHCEAVECAGSRTPSHSKGLGVRQDEWQSRPVQESELS